MIFLCLHKYDLEKLQKFYTGTEEAEIIITISKSKVIFEVNKKSLEITIFSSLNDLEEYESCTYTVPYYSFIQCLSLSSSAVMIYCTFLLYYVEIRANDYLYRVPYIVKEIE